jgi:hypothetical protein
MKKLRKSGKKTRDNNIDIRKEKKAEWEKTRRYEEWWMNKE